MTRKRLPSRRHGIRAIIQGVHLSTGNYADGTLGEIFLSAPKEGSFLQDIMNALAMSISMGLQHGITLEQFAHTYRHFKSEPPIIHELFAVLEQHYPQEVK